MKIVIETKYDGTIIRMQATERGTNWRGSMRDAHFASIEGLVEQLVEAIDEERQLGERAEVAADLAREREREEARDRADQRRYDTWHDRGIGDES